MSESNIFPSTWIDAALGQIAEFEMGQAPPGDACNHEGKGKLFVKAGEFGVNKPIEREWTTMPLKFGRQGDVFICVVGATCGKLNLGADCAIGRSVAAIRPGEIIDQHFLYYQLQLQVMALRAASAGSAQGVINRKQLSEIAVRIAPLDEQARIVAKIEELFSDLDAGVAALKRAKANLKRYRASVLKAAVEGKLTEQWRAKHPAKEPASALLARILKERRLKWEADQLAKFAAAKKEPPKNWKEKYVEPTPPDTTDLPELPEGWCWTNVGQLITESTCNGISIKGTDSPPGVPALRLNAMTENGFDYEKRRYIPISPGLATDLAIRLGDLFVSRGNGSLHLVGRGVLAQEPHEEIVFPDTMIRVRLFNIGSLRRFVSHVWASRLIRQQVENKARTTAGIYKISQPDVEEFVLPLPTKEEESRIVEEIEEKLTQISAAEQLVEHSLLRAARLRQSILKRAFEGKLVPQDPKDESASALLERLRTGRTHDEANGTAATSKRTRAKIKESSGEPRTRIRRRPSSQN